MYYIRINIFLSFFACYTIYLSPLFLITKSFTGILSELIDRVPRDQSFGSDCIQCINRHTQTSILNIVANKRDLEIACRCRRWLYPNVFDLLISASQQSAVYPTWYNIVPASMLASLFSYHRLRKKTLLPRCSCQSIGNKWSQEMISWSLINRTCIVCA